MGVKEKPTKKPPKGIKSLCSGVGYVYIPNIGQFSSVLNFPQLGYRTYNVRTIFYHTNFSQIRVLLAYNVWAIFQRVKLSQIRVLLMRNSLTMLLVAL